MRSRSQEVLDNPSLPARSGRQSDVMLKMLGVAVPPDYSRWRTNLVRYLLGRDAAIPASSGYGTAPHALTSSAPDFLGQVDYARPGLKDEG